MKTFMKGAVAATAIAIAAPVAAQDISVVVHGQANDAFWSVVKAGVDQAAADTGANVSYNSPETFDMANFIMGEAPVSVSAVGTSVVDPAIGAAGDVDTAAVTLTYADGRIAVIKNSRRAVYGYDQRVEVLGSEGLLQAQNVLENTLVKSTTAGVSSAKPTYFFLERYMPAYKAEWAAFVEAVQSKSDMPVNLHDGVAALAMAEAATRSAKTGQPVIMADVLEISGRGEAA